MGFAVFGTLFYLSIVYDSQYLIYVMCINSVFMGVIIGVAANYSSMLFNPNVRSSGLGLVYNLAFAIFNGMFLALSSYGIYKGIILAPLYLGMSVVIISVTILVLLRKINPR